MSDCHVGIHFWNAGPRSIGIQRLTTESTILPKSLLLHHEPLWPPVPGSEKCQLQKSCKSNLLTLTFRCLFVCFKAGKWFLKPLGTIITQINNETKCLNKSFWERLKLCKDDYSKACNLDCHCWLEWGPLQPSTQEKNRLVFGVFLVPTYSTETWHSRIKGHFSLLVLWLLTWDAAAPEKEKL